MKSHRLVNVGKLNPRCQLIFAEGLFPFFKIIGEMLGDGCASLFGVQPFKLLAPGWQVAEQRLENVGFIILAQVLPCRAKVDRSDGRVDAVHGIDGLSISVMITEQL